MPNLQEYNSIPHTELSYLVNNRDRDSSIQPLLLEYHLPTHHNHAKQTPDFARALELSALTLSEYPDRLYSFLLISLQMT